MQVSIAKKVEDVLNKMSLKDKIGQLSLGTFSFKKIDEAKVIEIITKKLRNFMRQEYGRIIPSRFQGTDRLPGNTHQFCKLILTDSPFLADLLNSIFHYITPIIVKLA